MGRKKPNIPPYLYESEFCGNFAMIPPDLYEAQAFQELSHAARNFYVLLAVNATSQAQKQCLYQTLKAYNDILQLGMSEEDVKYATWGNKRQHTFSTLFVIPAKQLEVYGYTPQYANKLKHELINHGFIKVAYSGKGRATGWSQNVTIYQFSGAWKLKRS